MVTRKDSRRYVIEFKLSGVLQTVKDLLESCHVKVIDKLGIVTVTNDYEEERVYGFIESHIKEWAEEYHIPHPQADDFICQS